jgi:tRNA (cmo5U34)-methyltransferase
VTLSPLPPQWEAADTELFLRFGDAFVPRRQEQIATVCALLAQMPRPAVLELGCGDGILTAEILREFPSATVTAVDASVIMLEAARKRLATLGSRVQLVEAALAGTSWRTGVYGAVVTSLAVHHLDHAGKRDLFGAVYGLLAPAGVYVQADLFLPATPAAAGVAAQQWDALAKAQSQSLYGSSQAYEAFRESQWNTFRFPDPADQPAALTDQLRWLADAGFTGIDVTWVLAGHAVLTATRPGGPVG